MKKLVIYLTHSSAFDFKNELYLPLKNSPLNSKYQIIFPHNDRILPNNSKTIIQAADLVLAEVSYPSTGQGIELGWADLFNKPIICLFQEQKTYSNSLNFISNKFICYKKPHDMINNLVNYLDNL